MTDRIYLTSLSTAAPGLIQALIPALAAAGSAVTAAVYVNFSTRVMPRLAALPDAEGIATMQQFNRTAVQWPFMTAFFGGALASGVVLVRGARALHGGDSTPVDWLATAGGACYLAGFVLTIAYNVPRNDQLAGVPRPVTVEGIEFWRRYLEDWTSANTVRAVLSSVATAALGSAAVRMAMSSPPA